MWTSAQIVPVTRNRVDDVVALTVAGFADDPGFSHVLPDDVRRLAALKAILGTAVRDAARSGTAHAAVRDGRPVGAAVWQAPGRYPMGLARRMRVAPAMAWAAMRIGPGFRQLARMGTELDARFPEDAVWYLQALAVRPDAQGTGVGTALLRHGLARADADRTDTYLETSTPTNLAFYEHAGFALTGSVTELFDGGPPMWFMRRRPAV